MNSLNKVIVILFVQMLFLSGNVFAGTDQDKDVLSPSLNIGLKSLQDTVEHISYFNPEINKISRIADVDKVKDAIFYNRLINRFFDLGEQMQLMRIPWSFHIHEIFGVEDPFIRDVIYEVESKGADWIIQEAENIRENHSSRGSYDRRDTGGSWASFIEKTKDKENYNLSHLLAHTLGLFGSYRDVGMKDKSREFLKLGYIILRAISIESAEVEATEQLRKMSGNQYLSEGSGAGLLPDVLTNPLSIDEAMLLMDKLGEAFEAHNMHFMDDGDDIDPNYAYSFDVTDTIKVNLLGQDPGQIYSAIDVPEPDTYYVAVTENEKVIGYGAIDHGMMPGEDNVMISFRIFKPYRHGSDKQSQKIFKVLLTSARNIFGSQVKRFVLPSHQIGGQEGLDSGALVFYAKLGFEPVFESMKRLWINGYRQRLIANDRFSRTTLELFSSNGIELDLNKMLYRQMVPVSAAEKRNDSVNPEFSAVDQSV